MSRLKAAMAVVFLLAATGCSNQMDRGNMMTGPGSMTGSRAMLLSVTPAGDATGVPSTTTVMLRFSQAMGGGMEQFIDLHEGDVTGPVVPISCAWASDRATLTCSLMVALKARTRYAVHVGGGMTGENGLPMNLGQMPMGAQWATPAMGTHGGVSWNMMGQGWSNANGSYGMMFVFTTA